MKTLIVLIASFLTVSLLDAQIPPFAWALRFTALNSTAIDVDNAGNVYTTGDFSEYADFDPDPDNVEAIDIYGPYSDAYVSKLDVNGNYVWAKNIGDDDTDLGEAIKVNSAHEVYIAGTFEGTTDLDPGPSEYSATSAGETDIFLVKLDAEGNFLWGITLGDDEPDNQPVLAIDASDNIYLAGAFRGTVDFDPGAGIVSMSSYSASIDVFIAKYTDSGDLGFVKTFEGSETDYPTGIDIDPSGNIITVGSMFGTVDFDPDPVDEANLTGTGETFISKLDASGNYVWAKALIGVFSVVQSYAVTVDDDGNIFTTGYCNGSVDLDPSLDEYIITTPVGVSYGFISKLDVAGNFVYGITFKTDFDVDGFAPGKGIITDDDGNAIVTGYFQDKVDFDPGVGEYMLETNNDAIFMAQFDPAGNFDWAFKIGDGKANGIAKGSGNTILSTGYFSIGFGGDPMDFDPGPGEFLMSGGGNYIQKLGTDGVGVDQILPAQVKIFPNPTNTSCNIYFEQIIDHATLIIFDLSGRIILRTEINNTDQIDINIQNLQPGIYNVEIADRDMKKNVRLVKQ